MDVYEWVQLGIKNGWCSEVFCLDHEGPPLTKEESDEIEAGYDPCIFCVRIDDVSETVVP